MTAKSGYVAIIGKPNAGKSTLMNALIGEKLSIITDKPQTTRKRILGILTEDDYQIIFIDTPGILNPEYLLQERMLGFVHNSVKDADIILFIVDVADDPDAKKTLSDEKVFNILKDSQSKKIILLNKVDLSNQVTVENTIRGLSSNKLFEKVIPVSAGFGYNLTSVKNAIVELLPEHPKYFPDEDLSDADERFFVTEIIREKVFEMYRDEVPYSTEVIIEEFKERSKGKDFINASIIVERDTQKKIIIGTSGEKIKKLGKISREAVESFLQRQVYLELFVKVREKWRSNPSMLKSFGYTAPDE
ncbi:MAG: GTPase Era [Ignavibacteriales bacterium]|nr:GTPase Era [Ignavibacteriales bacterium]